MKIRISEEQGVWRTPEGQCFYFGTYDVPRDMPKEAADLAVEQGAATLVIDPSPVSPVTGSEKPKQETMTLGKRHGKR